MIRVEARPGNPNPADHVGLAMLAANRAARVMRRRFGPEAPTANEMLGSAYLGVEMASRTFDPSRGLRFSTLATRNAYFMALRDGDKQMGMKRYGDRRRVFNVASVQSTRAAEDGFCFFDQWLGRRVGGHQ